MRYYWKMFSFILLNSIPRSCVTYNTPGRPWNFSVPGSHSMVQGQGTEHAEGVWCPWARGDISLLQTQGLTCLLRLQRVTFIAMEITDSTCSTGSHINKGLTEIQAALGVEWNSFFWQIVCCCHGYGTCCTSGLFPTPLGTFCLLMPGFPWIFFCSLQKQKPLSLGLISLCCKTLNLQVQLDVPVYGLSHSPACQQGPASQSGSPNSHSLSLLLKVMPWPFHFSICKQN